MVSMIRRRGYTFRRKPHDIHVSAGPTHRAYTRHITGKTVRVHPHMIHNRGLPGKGPYVLPRLRQGKLHGYHTYSPISMRHKSLMIASRRDSPLTVFRRLQVLARYLKRTSPGATRTVLANASWMRKKF